MESVFLADVMEQRPLIMCGRVYCHGDEMPVRSTTPALDRTSKPPAPQLTSTHRALTRPCRAVPQEWHAQHRQELCMRDTWCGQGQLARPCCRMPSQDPTSEFYVARRGWRSTA
jgi:hypothetical protein